MCPSGYATKRSSTSFFVSLRPIAITASLDPRKPRVHSHRAKWEILLRKTRLRISQSNSQRESEKEREKNYLMCIWVEASRECTYWIKTKFASFIVLVTCDIQLRYELESVSVYMYKGPTRQLQHQRTKRHRRINIWSRSLCVSSASNTHASRRHPK